MTQHSSSTKSNLLFLWSFPLCDINPISEAIELAFQENRISLKVSRSNPSDEPPWLEIMLAFTSPAPDTGVPISFASLPVGGLTSKSTAEPERLCVFLAAGVCALEREPSGTALCA